MVKEKCVCDDPTLTDAEKWETLVGTEYEGNLPQHKKHLHVGNCWCTCPYSLSTPDLRTRHLLGLADYESLPIRVAHTDGAKDYFMRPEYRSGWGYVCTFDNCQYYLDTGNRYFYK